MSTEVSHLSTTVEIYLEFLTLSFFGIAVESTTVEIYLEFLTDLEGEANRNIYNSRNLFRVPHKWQKK